MFHIYDSRQKKKIPFTPIKENEVSFYSCGPTVYNNVHVGNIRAFLFADLLHRYLKFGKKYEVKWVMNITDVDDKTIRDSQKKYPNMEPKEALKKFTREYEEIFFQDLEKMNVPRANFFHNPRATDFIPEMQELVKKIIKNGYGYIQDGSVYFNVKAYNADKKYGQLVSVDFDTQMSTERTENDEYEKENIADFVLWKGKKEGEPWWDFSVDGVEIPGRPGWHLECSAMEKDVLGLPFDIHSGGVDLCFPHHEDEIAQSVAGYGVDPNNYWVHNEHLMVEGKKMSKSLGNFYTLSNLEEKGFSPEVIRLFLVTSHYRKKINLSDKSLRSTEKARERVISFVSAAKNSSGAQDIDAKAFYENFFHSLDNDLNVSVAWAEFFSFASEVSKKSLSDTAKKYFVEVVETVENIFGVSFQEEVSQVPAEFLNMLEERNAARAVKDWAKADEIRDELLQKGYTIKDGPDGSVLIANC